MKEKPVYLLQALIFLGGLLLCVITWTDYYFWVFISIVGMILQALSAAWFIQTFRKRNTGKKAQWTIILATMLTVAFVAAFCFLPTFWIGRLQAACMLDGDMGLVDFGREECSRQIDLSKRADILVWMTMHINPLGAHTTEELAEIILASGCRKQYVEKAKKLLSSKTTTEDQREMLALYIGECEKAFNH